MERNIGYMDHNMQTKPLRPGNKTEIISLLKRKRKSRFMLLRSHAYVANKQHLCNCCCRYIEPGEMYEKDVRLSKNVVYETKKHSNPPCDYPRKEEEDMRKDYEEFMESQRLSEVA